MIMFCESPSSVGWCELRMVLTLLFEGTRRRTRSEDLPLVWMQFLLITESRRSWIGSMVGVWAGYAM